MQRAGIPDLCGCYRGHSIWFEVKMPSGRVSPLQEHTIKQLRLSGATAHVVYSPEECVKILTALEE